MKIARLLVDVMTVAFWFYCKQQRKVGQNIAVFLACSELPVTANITTEPETWHKLKFGPKH